MTSQSGEERIGQAGAAGRFQVLAIDGGGIRGIFSAAVLAQLEEDLGSPVVEHFDLVVGTSTGGIIALGLGSGRSAREILDFYVAERDRIFSSRWGIARARRLVVSKYRAAPLERAVREVFGDTRLGESQFPLVVPAYNLAENAVYLFKTPHHERLRRDHRVPMWEIAMATSAAPTYFPAWRLRRDRIRLIDGGVWANNPALVGVTEAVSMFGRSLEVIRLLSIGTTESVCVRAPRLDRAGLLGWLRGSPNVVDVLLDAQSAGAFGQVEHLLGRANTVRLSPPAPERAALDRCDAEELIGRAAHHSRTICPEVAEVFSAHRGNRTPLPGAPTQEAGARDGNR